MTEPSHSNDDDVEQLFLEYLTEVDRGNTSSLNQFLRTRRVSDQTRQELSTLMETEQIVQEMAGPSYAEAQISFPTPSKVDSEETVLFHPQSSAEFPRPNITLGEYEILEELGRGGMGVVYKAHQIEMNRDVAFKMIRGGCLASEEDVQRLYFEARAAGKLLHPNIVQVHQVGEVEGHHYFTMEYIQGNTLSKYAKRTELSPLQLAELMIPVAEAVDFAHQHGVLHRDLKPSNILVDAQGVPRVTDFGLAKDMSSGDQLTSSGSALGTPSYMPPEQALAKRAEITCRSDVYSLGAILYAILTERPPFKADSLVETMTQVIHEQPVPPREFNAQCPRDLEAICLKCLQKSPEERYATAAELADDLKRFVAGDRVSARRSQWYDRIWQWLRNVPMIAALLGRQTTTATRTHVGFQWGVLTLLLILVLGFWLGPWAIEEQRFRVVDFSTGAEDGSYYPIAQGIAESLQARTDHDIEVHSSAGAVESHRRLLDGTADIAILQDNTLDSDKLKVVAPLYWEAILVVVRQEIEASSLEDLRAKKIALGEPGSGMRISSEQLLRHSKLSRQDFDSRLIDRSFLDPQLEDARHQLDGAIVTLKLDDPELHHRLNPERNGGIRYRILNVLNQRREIPGLLTMPIHPDDLPIGTIAESGMRVPATLAILAVREDTPDRYVTDILEALYAPGGVTTQHQDLYQRTQAAEWKDLNYHSAASRYFSEIRRNHNLNKTP